MIYYYFYSNILENIPLIIRTVVMLFALGSSAFKSNDYFESDCEVRFLPHDNIYMSITIKLGEKFNILT